MPTTLSLNDIKQATLQMMSIQYGAVPSVTDDDLVKNYFMRKDDCMALRACCQQNNLTVVLQQSDALTLTRITQGHPCKDHNITDKPIAKLDGHWSYTSPNGENEDLAFHALAGLIGYSAKDDSNLTLAGIWAYANGKVVQEPLEQLGVDFPSCFTGGYTLCDIFKDHQAILSGTAEEDAVLEILNNALLASDHKRLALVNKTLSDTKKIITSPYALLRTGAQASAIRTLLSLDTAGDKLPVGITVPSTIMSLALPVVMFDPKGAAYILDDMKTAYFGYLQQGIMDELPFFYFINDLHTTEANQGTLDTFTPFFASAFSKQQP